MRCSLAPVLASWEEPVGCVWAPHGQNAFLSVFLEPAAILSVAPVWDPSGSEVQLPPLLLDAGQSKCRLERAQALEQAKKPQEAVFVPECGEDGSFTQVGLGQASRAQVLDWGRGEVPGGSRP